MMVHDLDGCAPAPLAHYLKALGILRLVAEQADSKARGWWEGERFRLATFKSYDDLTVFFLENYCPTPLLAPWNGASGFFKTWDEKAKRLRKSKNTDALETLLSLDGQRWEQFHQSFSIARDVLESVLKEIDVQELPKKQRKDLLIVPRGDGPVFSVANKDNDKAQIQEGMMRLFARHEFYRSAIVNMGEGEIAYPSLWGSGGNDGAIDFTARYFENLIHVLVNTPKPISGSWLNSALFAVPAYKLLTGKKGKVGQFLPGGAGGANSIAGIGSQNDTLLNPWDFILMMEGAVLFTAHATRRFGVNSQSRAAAPFAISGQGAGYASAALSDENARGEQWMPLWSQPLTLVELRRLLAEGRAQIGARAAREPLDMARAVARLGAARGIFAFQRYGYIERNGQSNLAVPLGRFRVPDRASVQLSCIDDLDAWLNRLRRESRAKNAPSRLDMVTRKLSGALFAVTQHPAESRRWQSVLLAMADVESVLRTGTGVRSGPIPPLRPEWCRAADDSSPEFRLALSFALQSADLRNGHPLDRVRRHWLPLDGVHFATTDTGGQARIQTGPEVVFAGRRGIDDAIALINRRLVEAGQRGERRLPLAPARKASARPADLARLLAGAVDLDRTLQLACALMAIDSRQWAVRPFPPAPPVDNAYPDDAWLAVRLALLPCPLPDGRMIGADAAIVRRLESGDVFAAIKIALQRLRAAGITSTFRLAVAGPETARLWVAALAFPITKNTAADFLRRLDVNSLKEKTS